MLLPTICHQGPEDGEGLTQTWTIMHKAIEQTENGVRIDLNRNLFPFTLTESR